MAKIGALVPENTRRIGTSGGFKLNGVKFLIGSQVARNPVALVREGRAIAVYDLGAGAPRIECPTQNPVTPTPETPRPWVPKAKRESSTVTQALTHQSSPMS